MGLSFSCGLPLSFAPLPFTAIGHEELDMNKEHHPPKAAELFPEYRDKFKIFHKR
jgi:hypothetical protein